MNFDDPLEALGPEAYQGASLSLGERLRLRDVTPERVRLAAFLGDAEAQALGEGAWSPAPDAAELREVEAVLRAGELEPTLIQRAAAEAAARVLDLAEGGPEGAVLRRCVRVARGVELLDEAAVEALLEEAYEVASREGASSAALACATSARTVLGGPMAGAAAAKTFALALEACADSDTEREQTWQRESLIGLLLEGPESAQKRTVFSDAVVPSLETSPEDFRLEPPALDSPSLTETIEHMPVPSFQSTIEPAPQPERLQSTVERAPARLPETPERPAPLLLPPLAPEPRGPPGAGQIDSSLGRFSYDAIPDDPFAAREAGPDWRENPWVQGGFCVTLALVLAFFGTVPIALAGAALAVAVLYPIVPKLAELAALVLGSCLVAFFLFELLRGLDFFEFLQGAIALVVGWGPISLWLNRD